MANIKPKYRVEKLEGTVTRTLFLYEGGVRTEKTVEEDAGYMVYFPRGHSIRLSEAELIRQGFDKPAPMFDDDGELEEEQVAQMTGRGKKG